MDSGQALGALTVVLAAVLAAPWFTTRRTAMLKVLAAETALLADLPPGAQRAKMDEHVRAGVDAYLEEYDLSVRTASNGRFWPAQVASVAVYIPASLYLVLVDMTSVLAWIALVSSAVVMSGPMVAVFMRRSGREPPRGHWLMVLLRGARHGARG